MELGHKNKNNYLRPYSIQYHRSQTPFPLFSKWVTHSSVAIQSTDSQNIQHLPNKSQQSGFTLVNFTDNLYTYLQPSFHAIICMVQ